MPLTEARIKANRKWDSENLERISVVFRSGEKEQIKTAANAAGESLNHYIVSSVRARMKADEKESV